MPISDIQLAFWTRLKESNPELFNGNPQGEHYFDIKIENVDHVIIRLDIYLCQRDFEEKGVQTIALVVSPETNRMINTLYEDDCESLKKDCVINRVTNKLLTCPIDQNDNNWQPYIDWFTKYTSAMKDLLLSLKK